MVHIGAIERVVRDLDLDLVAVAAEPFAVARSVVGDDPNANISAVLIDVGGGTTDIAVLRDGGLEGTRMFGIGGRSFTRTIARDLGLEFADAEELKISLSSGDISEEQRHQVEASIKKTLGVWIQGVQLAMSEFDWLDYLPHKILLCGGGSSLELLREALKSKSWRKDLPFSKDPVTQLIEVADVAEIKDASGKLNDHTMITAMGLARVGNDTLGFDTNASVRGRISKVLEN